MIKIKDSRLASGLASKNDIEQLQARLNAIETALIKPTPAAPSVHKSLEMKGTVQRDGDGKIVSLSFLGDTPIKASVQRDSEGKFSGVLIVEQKKTLLTDYLN